MSALRSRLISYIDFINFKQRLSHIFLIIIDDHRRAGINRIAAWNGVVIYSKSSAYFEELKALIAQDPIAIGQAGEFVNQDIIGIFIHNHAGRRQGNGIQITGLPGERKTCG